MKKNNVLVVDDDKEIVDAIEIYLKNEGINVIKAYDGLEALEVLMENNVQLILMDIMMPVMNGVEALKEIKKLGVETPVIALTADAIDGQEDKYLKEGFDGYLSKPIDKNELKKILNKYLKGEKNE